MPLGALKQADAFAMTWVSEGLAVLTWALGLGKLPKHDRAVDPYELTDAVGLLSDDANDLIASAKVRDSSELGAYRNLVYAIHCRLRDFSRNHAPKDFTMWFEAAWLRSLGLHESGFVKNKDLILHERSITEASEDELQNAEWTIREQHRAIIWLTGEQPENEWWMLTVDT